ncbi:MAG: DUF4326 domain-containing protein [Pseudomonadota bacterium]
MPVRIKLSRKRGWRMPPNTVVVSRPSRWGNPFVIGRHGNRDECVTRFTQLLNGVIHHGPDLPSETAQQDYLRHLREHGWSLVGKNLACWCPLDEPCHAETLIHHLRLGGQDYDTQHTA